MAEISLEALANEIEVLTERGYDKLRIARIEGHVTKAEGRREGASRRKYLRIHLNLDTQGDGFKQLNFYGTSPVRGGDKIRAGIILDEDTIKYRGEAEAFYIEIINERGHYIRRDFREYYRGPWFNRDLGLEN